MKNRNVDDLEPIAAKLLDQMDADGPGVLDEGHGFIASYSIAFSLKRIADALEQQASIAATTATYAPASTDLRGIDA